MKISERIINGKRLSSLKAEPIDGVTPIAIQTNAEGSVLLENDGMLPLKKGDRISVFGRMQTDYYNSGTGSGGMVNTQYKTNIYDSLAENKDIILNEELAGLYSEWLKDNPFDFGDGWTQPWSQKEMPISHEIAQSAAAVSDKAVVIIARTAGEDCDNSNNGGSYLLSDEERGILKNVSEAFNEVCVILNTGNILDMKWVKEFNINAVLYVWQGGQDGGRAATDILCGKLYPSGKLSDTIVKNIEDYPSYAGFNETEEIEYCEDIFVGYRYFETFARDKVLYPFGYGMGYTKFEFGSVNYDITEDKMKLYVPVKNVGQGHGKEVVQVYFEAVGKNRPARELVAFEKSKELAPSGEEILELSFDINDMASYDEEKSRYALEAGTYNIYVGTDVRSAALAFSYVNKATVITKQCSPRLRPNREFPRIVNNNGIVAYERVASTDEEPEIVIPEEIPYTGNKGIKLEDVYNGKAKLEDFVAQLCDYDMACLSQGEGLNSPKVRPGTGGAIGGVTKSLKDFGIPVVCVTDGPSGIRMDNGDKAVSLPNGTMLACTWDSKLVERLYTYEGMEAYAYRIDAMLGPGINIHRTPLCGRNFEYLSEDPYLTGVIGTAICAGLDNAGVTATIKHFAANNRETNRHRVSSLVSERALREIYLKPFEMAIKSGRVRMLMTAYNRINGKYCAGNYDLTTGILKDEWGYNGLVISDWWPKTFMKDDGEATTERKYQVRAQNDVFMVNKDAEEPAQELTEAVKRGDLTRAELQRGAKNICRIVMTTPTFERYMEGDVIGGEIDAAYMRLDAEYENIGTDKEYVINTDEPCGYALEIEYVSDKNELMQITVRVFVNEQSAGVFAVNGTDGQIKSDVIGIYLMKGENKITFEFDEKSVALTKLNILK